MSLLEAVKNFGCKAYQCAKEVLCPAKPTPKPELARVHMHSYGHRHVLVFQATVWLATASFGTLQNLQKSLIWLASNADQDFLPLKL